MVRASLISRARPPGGVGIGRKSDFTELSLILNEIAKKRNHPHQDAIHVAGWVSLMTLHTIWPFLWIWATIYRPERGYGFAAESGETKTLDTRIADLEARLAVLEGKPPAGNETL